MWVRERKYLFYGVAALMLLQVSWWGALFVRNVNEMAGMSKENLQLQSHIPGLHATSTIEKIESHSYHRKWMFLSESIFFALLTCVGLWGLYRALALEERSRGIQRNFINIVSHETKTPLTALKLRLEMIRDQISNSETQTEIDLALDEVRRLASTFDKTMSLNRLERGVFHFEELSLSEMVRELLGRLDPFFRVSNTEIAWKSEAEGWVKADSYCLTNSIQNLIENAVIYNTSACRQIELQLTEQGEQIRLSIKDNGPGIPEREAKEIFEKFYRGSSSRGTSGTGLRLYLSKLVVEAHGGTLRLLSGTKGGAFELFLPKVTTT